VCHTAFKVQRGSSSVSRNMPQGSGLCERSQCFRWSPLQKQALAVFE
jgi:hypothetical protein